MTSLVIVESPAKAKTIEKYLGPGFQVLASYGHIRDLPAKNGSVRPDEDFAMDWEIDDRSRKQVKAIEKAVKGVDSLILATDPDREGEAISWHVRDVLENKNLLKGVEVQRVVFNEITKPAILEAFSKPRELNNELVDAYLARRALDYLVGFTLSPVLWRKLPGSRSAGRVQSVALRIICERETEIEAFDPQEYWSIEASLTTPDGATFTAALNTLNGEKVKKLSLKSETEAQNVVALIEAASLSINKIERKQSRRNPAAPFTTSTLQQEAARKLYFATKKTMQVAQRLYEGITIEGETVGLITYMRTDGINMSLGAVESTRSLINSEYGKPYLPEAPRVYKNKAKNAQEAHEAIRPTDLTRKPKDLAGLLDEEQLKLYELIWKRTVASQMESAVIDQVGVDIPASNGSVALRATGSVIAFDGFLKLYQEGNDEKNGSDNGTEDSKVNDTSRMLPPMVEGSALKKNAVQPEQHFTQPPPRYSEASLVKILEEYGIGRPSTYASIISVLQDRNYVRLESRRFFPENRGRVVVAFLSRYFHKYVEYDFTAELENELDEISAGNINWKSVLREFWEPFYTATEEMLGRPNREVIDAIDESLGPHFFPKREDGIDTRKCPTCDNGRLGLKPGRTNGFFIGCSNYPECEYTRPLGVVTGDKADAETHSSGPRELGTDPETGLMISLRKGPYGPYIQRGEALAKGEKKKKDAPKPKRASLPKDAIFNDVDLDRALQYLSLPRDIGEHPETHNLIAGGLGPFGPFLRYQGNFYSLKQDDVLEIGLNRAVTVIGEAPHKDPVIELGKHPDDKKPITQKSGRWGPFVQHGRLKANLPKGTDKDSVTFEMALELLAAKAAKDPKSKAKAKAKPKAKKKTKPKAKTKAKAKSKPKPATADAADT